MNSLLQAALRAIRARRVLVFVDLVQDIDVLLPVILALRAEDRLAPVVRVSRWLAAQSPRTAALLEAHGVPFSFVRRHEVIEGQAPPLRGIAAVLSAAESSHPAHAAGHALALRAAASGLPTYTLQHGFENVGLTGVESDAAGFASDVVFCWFPAAQTPTDLPSATRAKLVHAGRPSPVDGWRGEAEPAFDLGVFENLHWERYSDADRAAFREGLKATAAALPNARIVIRPHPAGSWADSLRHELAPFANITAASAAEARRELAGSAEILRGIKRVITTPSTIALDAALAGRPVALAAAGGELYEPLPLLRTPEDWIAFASAPADRQALDLFRSRVLVAADGTGTIIDRLRHDLLSAGPRIHG